MRQLLPHLRAVSPLMISLALAGCASTTGPSSMLGYYWQSVQGHMHHKQAAEPSDRWIARTDIPPALRERLQRAQPAKTRLIMRGDTARRWGRSWRMWAVYGQIARGV